MRREVSELAERVSRLEAELSRRPGPDFCPLCGATLEVERTQPLIGGLERAQFGEVRHIVCSRAPDCTYTREQRVEF